MQLQLNLDLSNLMMRSLLKRPLHLVPFHIRGISVYSCNNTTVADSHLGLINFQNALILPLGNLQFFDRNNNDSRTFELIL